MLGCFSRLRRHHTNPSTIINASDHAPPAAGSAVVRNFNTLYEPISDSDTSTTVSSSQAPTLTFPATASAAAAAPEAYDFEEVPDDPDLISSAVASGRLFPASPGSSNSIVDSGAGAASIYRGPGGTYLAVSTYSLDPYWDFRRSMEEIVAAISQLGGGENHLNLAVLRQLLLSYLAVNGKHAHRYIIRAFSDLLLTVSADEKLHRESCDAGAAGSNLRLHR
ncbi:hypothetical protein AXF42_Ash002100 [Apostasia shenzhenica]|uniref:Transcription repressor n=1 Tax=Apostasia shenzhenica TaxID=1088818 RepID=A0A2I0AML1_9ASPA|nr:hypothetical protein AXF42_Ash002100 [Apostasia shenzhenica]